MIKPEISDSVLDDTKLVFIIIAELHNIYIIVFMIYVRLGNNNYLLLICVLHLTYKMILF